MRDDRASIIAQFIDEWTLIQGEELAEAIRTAFPGATAGEVRRGVAIAKEVKRDRVNEALHDFASLVRAEAVF